MLVCGSCKSVQYCSQDCQRACWPSHKRCCGKLEPFKWLPKDGSAGITSKTLDPCIRLDTFTMSSPSSPPYPDLLSDCKSLVGAIEMHEGAPKDKHQVELLDTQLKQLEISSVITTTMHSFTHFGQLRKYREAEHGHRCRSRFFCACTPSPESMRNPKVSFGDHSVFQLDVPGGSYATTELICDFIGRSQVYMYREEDRITNARYSNHHLGKERLQRGGPMPPFRAYEKSFKLDANDNIVGFGMWEGMYGMTGYFGPGTRTPFRWESDGPFKIGELSLQDNVFKEMQVYVPKFLPKGTVVVVAKFSN